MRIVIALLLVSTSCMQRELEDVIPEVQSGPTFEIVQTVIDEIDLLVLVDNSGSMEQEQDSLSENMPALIDALTNPGDADGDGLADPAVRSLHIGVISSDMGTMGMPVCDAPDRGDDGVLQNLPGLDVPGCDATYPPFLTYDADDPDAGVGADFRCVATLGTGGCGFEQQLFAVEKALTVHSAPGAANDGFLRADSLLAVLVVTDEEDCSASDPAIYSDDLGPPNLRCSQNPGMVRPVDEFVDAVLALRPGHPERIVVAGIVGVPTDLAALEPGQVQDRSDYERILDDPRMQEIVDGAGENLVPSCDVPGLGKAYPPRRIVDFIRKVGRDGENGIVQSICQPDWGPTMQAITRIIRSKIDGACLPRQLSGPNGVPLVSRAHAQCVVRETLTDSRDCGPGRIEVDTRNGQTVCQICQQGDGEGEHLRDPIGNDLSACAGTADHWFYTTEAASCAARIEFTAGATPEDGSHVRLECLSTLPRPES